MKLSLDGWQLQVIIGIDFFYTLHFTVHLVWRDYLKGASSLLYAFYFNMTVLKILSHDSTQSTVTWQNFEYCHVTDLKIEVTGWVPVKRESPKGRGQFFLSTFFSRLVLCPPNTMKKYFLVNFLPYHVTN